MITSVDVSGHDAPLNLPLWGYEDGFYIKEITGLGPVAAELSTTSRARFDGLRLQNVRKGVRNIVMTVGLLTGHHTRTVESLRHELYLSYAVGREVDLTFNREGLDSLHIKGIVESVDDSIFSREPEVIISVVCMDPYYRVGEPQQYSTPHGKRYNMSLDIEYSGNISNGMRIWVQTGSGAELKDISIKAESNYGTTILNAIYDNYRSLTLDNRGSTREFRFDNTSSIGAIGPESNWPRLYPGYNTVTATIAGVLGTGNFRTIFDWDILQDYV